MAEMTHEQHEREWVKARWGAVIIGGFTGFCAAFWIAGHSFVDVATSVLN